ncbi:type I-G CRISPR-associated protein Csb2 [Saccharopolyspora erythraea]|uniref:type I-G CRISPR-associated protein Csb2 n=1 Tax=Saccharopolyspora erythraea TaxID=1836 RepID=UPI001E43F416|nr:type I-U CRISPR-associated protein Csb2 [Saccharopolyspora erythraea]
MTTTGGPHSSSRGTKSRDHPGSRRSPWTRRTSPRSRTGAVTVPSNSTDLPRERKTFSTVTTCSNSCHCARPPHCSSVTTRPAEHRKNPMTNTFSDHAGDSDVAVDSSLAERMVVFGFPSGIRVEAKRSGVVTAMLRKAIMSRMPEPLPPEVSGHNADELTHVAYLAVPDAGGVGARGDITSVAVWTPRGTPNLVSQISAALTTGKPLHLDLPGVRLRLRPQDAEPVTAGLSGPSRSWTTVTPMVLDRYPGKGREAAEIARTCIRSGLPSPIEVTTSRNPFVHGAADLGRSQLPRRDNRPYTHAKITFAEPATGPVLLGSQRYLGMGLFLPTHS